MNPRADDDRVKVFVVPDLGEGLEEVTMSYWHVAVGDDVELNQTLCSVETAKARSRSPARMTGRIVEIRGAEGDVLAVGSLLARIDTRPGHRSRRRRPTANRPLAGRYWSDMVPMMRWTPAGGVPKPNRASGNWLPTCWWTSAMYRAGADGLISRDAVLAAAGVGTERPGVSSDVLPVRGVHSHMAERMTLSRSIIPDAHASVQVDCTALMRLRDRLRALVGDDDEAISPFLLTLRLLVIALTHNKILNSTWVDGPDGPQVHSHHAVHLGFAVATPRGLLVPVITDAQDKTTRELAECVARLIGQARAGTLKPAELTGSTFTVSNFGALGLDDGVPVINYPEAAILGMGSLKPRPMVMDDTVVIRPQMTLTCAFDHRIADGANVARFFGELRTLIESPETALLDL